MLKIKESVTHQNIGGKEFRPEFTISPYDLFKKSLEGNIACFNFCMRRAKDMPSHDKKLFYGHVGTLGYVICEDELEGNFKELENIRERNDI